MVGVLDANMLGLSNLMQDTSGVQVNDAACSRPGAAPINVGNGGTAGMDGFGSCGANVIFLTKVVD